MKKKSRKTVKKKALKKTVRKKSMKKPKIVKDKKVLYIVVDGMGDLPMGDGGITPLSAGNLKNIDWFAKNGSVGDMTVVPSKFWNEMTKASVSHLAAVSLLGYSLDSFALKRGPMEAVGNDIPYQQGHLAMRFNFATVDGDGVVVDRRAGRNFKGLNDLCKEINDKVNIGAAFSFTRTYGHRGVLIVKMGLSDRLALNDPLSSGKKANKISGNGPEAVISAKILQTFVDKSHELLNHHAINAERMSDGLPSANYILLREAGNNLQQLPCFSKKFGVTTFCISEPGVDRGACILAGFESVKVPEMSFDDTLDFIFENVDFAFEDHDFVFVHIKGPIDEAAHDKNFNAKKEGLEFLDRKLEKFRKFKGVLVLTTDHLTSSENGKHMPGKVPLLVYGLGKDSVSKFDEESVQKGKLKNFTPLKLIKYSLGKK